MRTSETVGFEQRAAIVAKLIALLCGAMVLTTCTSTDDGAVNRFLSGENLTKDSSTDLDESYFKPAPYCPSVRIRAGTGAIVVYERGQEATPSFVQHQATITRTARECVPTADGLSIKLGIAGRVVAGPKGGPGTVTLPVRFVVSKAGETVLYSELFKLPVSLDPPNLNTDFSKVFAPVAVPVGAEERDIIIFVGFDEGKVG